VNVALCRTNLMRLGPAAVGTLRAACAEAGAKLEVRGCLDRCATCPTAVLALVDGAFVGAASADELAEAIRGVAG
jgi:uncharacterized protein YuzB (UPF0349 family)